MHGNFSFEYLNTLTVPMFDHIYKTVSRIQKEDHEMMELQAQANKKKPGRKSSRGN